MMKQVLVLRKDLDLGKGKLAAHAAHASLAAYRKAEKSHPEEVEEWIAGGEKKVAVSAGSEAELLELFGKAKRLKMPCALIRDAGLTQISPGTATALGIGPFSEGELDKLTGHLKLL
ncbi:MAG: peptidyl-tRNA hydrolase Pth2 [Candidatus ainarchaeum sp.]|nr:peptidyl-tRNA hydrolase Pth2 [Candidatus ainarchaeum sp.]